MSITRRAFIQVLGAASASTLFSSAPAIGGKHKGRVVIIGGGFGGATAAKYIRRLDNTIDVTLIEPKKHYVTCPGSNWVLGGMQGLDSITMGYDELQKNHGVHVIHGMAKSVDTGAHTVELDNGKTVKFDRLIVSPGIDFRYDEIEGYSASDTETVPHAWQAGEQTKILHQQLEAMSDGGTVIIAAPPNPFRCPPGPYERASMIAFYLSQHKPKSKIVILDAKDKFSKQGLFENGWKEFYGYGSSNSMIEWVPASNDGVVKEVDVKNRTAITQFDEHKADVLNVIPPQKAGHFAHVASLVDESGWCPVDQRTYESTLQPGIHVIGDACIADPLPKSGYAANSEAKVCAFAVVASLHEKEPPSPSWINTCYSLITPDYGISVAMVYDLGKDGNVQKVEGAGGLTQGDSNYSSEALYAKSWYENITRDVWG